MSATQGNPQPYPDESSPMPYDGEEGMLLPLLMQIANFKPPQSADLEEMAKPDYDGQETAYAGVPRSSHIRAPLSQPGAMGKAGGLSRILAGLGGANRRGQMAAYRVGKPGVAYDAWKTGSPPRSSLASPPTVPPVSLVRKYDGTTAYDGPEFMSGDPSGNPGAARGALNPVGGGGGNPAPNPNYSGGAMPPPAAANPTDPNANPYGGQMYPSGAQTLGAPMYPWMMPWQGQFTAPMSPYEQQGLGGMSNFVGGGMGLGGAQGYNNALLSGQYIGSANPYMGQIAGGMQALKDYQDQQAEKQIASSMAAGGNALSGARMSANQQYQNLSNANFNQNMGNMEMQNLARERALQNQGVGQAMGLANTQMGGYGNLMNAGALPRQLQQQDLNSQYGDWLRQIQTMNQSNQNQQALGQNMIRTGYPGGSSQPNYGQSSAEGWGALLAGLLGGGGSKGGGGGSMGGGSGGGGGLVGAARDLYNSIFGGGGGNAQPGGQWMQDGSYLAPDGTMYPPGSVPPENSPIWGDLGGFQPGDYTNDPSLGNLDFSNTFNDWYNNLGGGGFDWGNANDYSGGNDYSGYDYGGYYGD